MATSCIDPKHRLVTQKARSLVSLAKDGVSIPPTLISGSTMGVISRIKTDQFGQHEWFYLRLMFSDVAYPHYFSSLCKASEIQHALHRLEEKARHQSIELFDIIVQPFVEFAWTGGLMTKGRFVLIEVVEGPAVALFRKGFLRHRILLDKRGQVQDSKSEMQPYVLIWRNSKWQRVRSRKTSFELERYLKDIIKIASVPSCFYEIGFTEEKIYFLENKPIPPKSYLNLLSGSIGRPFPIYWTQNSRHRKKETRIKFPAFEYISNLNDDTSLLVSDGAYLSHLCYSRALERRNCVFI